MNEYSDKEMKNWRDSKKILKQERTEFTVAEYKIFLDCIVKMSPQTVFEAKLGLSRADVEFYKTKYDINSQDQARNLLKELLKQLTDSDDSRIEKNRTSEVERTRLANDRLEKSEKDLAVKKEFIDPNKDEIRAKEKKAQSRLDKQEHIDISKHIPFVDDEQTFKRDLTTKGVTFCCRKYDVTPLELKKEVLRLNLKINWEILRR